MKTLRSLYRLALLYLKARKPEPVSHDHPWCIRCEGSGKLVFAPYDPCPTCAGLGFLVPDPHRISYVEYLPMNERATNVDDLRIK